MHDVVALGTLPNNAPLLQERRGQKDQAKFKAMGKGQDLGKCQGPARLCYNCGKPGHTKANCRELHPDKKGSGGKGHGGKAKITGLD